MDPIDLSQPMQQAAFAELVGVSKPAVTAWVKEGRLRRGESGATWLRAYLTWLRDEAAGRGEQNPLTAARARLAAANADRAEAEVRRLNGDLIPREAAVRAVHDAFRELRNALQQMPRRVAGMVVGLDAEAAERKLTEELRKTLADAANQRIPEAGVDRMDGGE